MFQIKRFFPSKCIKNRYISMRLKAVRFQMESKDELCYLFTYLFIHSFIYLFLNGN